MHSFVKRVLAVPLLAGSASLLVFSCATTGPAPAPAEAKLPAKPNPARLPVPLIAHALTPEQIDAGEAQARQQCDLALASVAALPDAQRTFANTPEAYEQAVMEYLDAVQRLGILKDVHPDEKVRAAAAAVEERAGKYLVELSARRDLYRAVKAYLAHAGSLEALDADQQRLLELTLREFKRSGLELSDEKLQELVALRTRMTELATRFQSNLNENTDGIVVTKEELAGLPDAFVQRLQPVEAGKKSATKRMVTTKYPDYLPFMENARSEAARKRMYVAFMSRESARNLPILTEVIGLRDQAARLLGYATHADFVTEDRMASSAAKVAEFLGPLRDKLKPRRDQDLARLTALKRLETKKPKAVLEPWDVAYYLGQLKKKEYALDNEKIREYFPMPVVMGGMFRVYETLLSIDIREVADADVWAEGVKLYGIHDRESGELLAYFYNDLHPRPGKYGHAGCAPVTIARQTPAGYRIPIAVMMTNFTPPTAEAPSLLGFEEVRTLFHEFGHIMHQTLTTARYGSQAGTSVAGDFVEAPSQMLESWVYQPEVLALMSGHFRDPSEKLPEETIRKIKEARTYNAGWHYTRQVFLATFDQALHTSGGTVDPDAVDARLYQEILGLAAVPGTHFAASFGHLLGGYDAGYYGYLWSEVFAADMFTRFESEGVLNPAVGRRYRDTILAKGRSVEPDVLLEEFLGRKPNDAAFLKQLGL